MMIYCRLIQVLLVSFIIVLPQIVYSQQPPVYSITGKLVDEQTGNPLEFATVTVKKLKDSTLVTGAITDATGQFKISELSPGGFLVEIAFIGYEKHVANVFFRPPNASLVHDIGLIKLKLSAQLLEGAEITADKSYVMNNIDRKTYNTGQLSVATGGNVTDVLQNIPSVEVDAEGTVSLRGNENVTILIDGRPSGLTSTGGKSLLESIPSSAIEKIEVITNPSAKYDPDGISGIINIITKKNKLQGFTGSVGANTSFEDRYGANLSLSYRKNKWNIYTNYGYQKDVRNFSGSNYRETYFNDVTEILDQDDKGTHNRENHSLKTGIDYNLTSRSSISVSGLISSGEDNGDEHVIYRFYDNNNVLDSIYRRETLGEGSNTNLDLEAAFRHNFKKEGQVLNIQGNASFDEGDDMEDFIEQAYLDDFTPDPSVVPLMQKDKSLDDNFTYTASADYEHPLSKESKIEGGYKSTFRKFDNDFTFFNYDETTGSYVNDITRTNHFIYSDDVHALYTQYRHSFGSWGAQAGIRGEFAQTQSELLNTSETFNKEYFSFFPSAFLTYQFNQKTQAKASYSRRINRPGRRSLNPFADYDDPLNIRKGNPYLDPEYTDSYELEFTRFIGKISFTSTGYFRWTHDYIQRHRIITPEGITITTFENLSSARNYGLELIFNGSPYKWWNFTLSSNMYRNEIDATNLQPELSSASFAFSGRLLSTFKLPYATELQLTYFYRAPMNVPQGKMQDMQMFTIAASKKVLKEKGLITVRLSDPFNTQRFSMEFREPLYYQEFTRKRESRILNIGFTYRFGELKDRDQRRQRNNQNNEMQRDEMDFD